MLSTAATWATRERVITTWGEVGVDLPPDFAASCGKSNTAAAVTALWGKTFHAGMNSHGKNEACWGRE